MQDLLDYYQCAALTLDSRGLPKWGASECQHCDSYGWLAEVEESSTMQATTVKVCECVLPYSDDDYDRLQERLYIVAKIITQDSWTVEHESDHDLH